MKKKVGWKRQSASDNGVVMLTCADTRPDWSQKGTNCRWTHSTRRGMFYYDYHYKGAVFRADSLINRVVAYLNTPIHGSEL